MALSLWSSRNGPVQYNHWQSVYFSLIRDYGYADEEAGAGEDPVLRQARIRRLYREIQESIHGPDYRAEALLSARPKSRGLTVSEAIRPPMMEDSTALLSGRQREPAEPVPARDAEIPGRSDEGRPSSQQGAHRSPEAQLNQDVSFWTKASLRRWRCRTKRAMRRTASSDSSE